METFVSIDIETTGLDSNKDSIIEIGAVKFTDRRVEGEWNTLINPSRSIPPEITMLTGISDLMVVNAPDIKEVIDDLKSFVGDAELMGHNVRFDLSFLYRYKIFNNQTAIDTYEIASVLLPSAARYNLSSLSQQLGVMLPATHRALDDAQATRGVFLRLFNIAMELPMDLLTEIVRLSESLDWGGYSFFQNVLRSRAKENLSPPKLHYAYHGPLFEDESQISTIPLEPTENPQSLAAEEVSSILEPGGLFSKHFDKYEYRSQQVAMLQAVTNAISEGRHLLVEAGTGTGKSMAYLIPTALWSVKNNYRVVISTNTINLQDQLLNKDIPDLRKALGIDLYAVVVKGRSNYLCPRHLENLRRRSPSTVEEMRVLAKILVWLRQTRTGDRTELNLNGPVERDIWLKLSAEDEGCTADNCSQRLSGICPYYRVHQSAQSAHILIVNHALLLSDMAAGNRVIPAYDYLIVDEAHHLEDATTNAMSYHLSQLECERLLRELGGPNSGYLGRLNHICQDNLSPEDYGQINRVIQRITDIAFRLDTQIQQFFNAMDQYLFEIREGNPIGAYPMQVRIIPASRRQPTWEQIETTWEETETTLGALRTHVEQIMHVLVDLFEQILENNEDLFSSFSALLRRINEFIDNIHALVFEPQTDRIYWVEQKNDNRGLSLHAAPLHIGSLMQKFIWYEKKSVILTSATLTTTDEFDYIRGRLYAEDAEELALGSPFDFETSTLVYLVNDIPEPSDRYGFQRAVEIGLINLCKATGGKALALFTSYEQLKRTSQAITSALSKEDIIVYEQGEGASPHSLLESFRYSERAILLGTRAFWEGVDVPGEALSLLVIVKLPFDVPNDPIISARSETFEDPFYQYSLPEAILRFRQGFGRLIRTRNDRGAVVILDRRILSKRYGQQFIDSLPMCTFKSGQLLGAPRIVTKWLNL